MEHKRTTQMTFDLYIEVMDIALLGAKMSAKKLRIKRACGFYDISSFYCGQIYCRLRGSRRRKG